MKIHKILIPSTQIIESVTSQYKTEVERMYPEKEFTIKKISWEKDGLYIEYTIEVKP